MTDLDFYRSQSPFTDPGKYSGLFAGLPRDVKELQRIIANVRVNFYSDQLVLGYKAPPERLPEIELRTVEKMLAQIQRLQIGPLTVERPVDKRVVGTCRDSSILMVSMLRHLGIPARLRSGFSPSQLSFMNMIRDHSVCEYWNKQEGRWVVLEAELTKKHLEFHRNNTTLDLTSLEFPYFEHAGKAVMRWLSGDTKRYDYLDQGFWFFRNLLMRDVAFLNKVEVNIWDHWGVMLHEPGISSPATVELLRQICEGDQQSQAFTDRVRKLYLSDERLRVPDRVVCRCPAHEDEADMLIWSRT